MARNADPDDCCYLVSADGSFHTTVLRNGTPVVVGRQSDTFLNVTDGRCSRKHVEVTADYQNQRVILKHLGVNPSKVRGVLLKPGQGASAVLHHDDTFELIDGMYMFRIVFQKGSPSDVSLPKPKLHGQAFHTGSSKDPCLTGSPGTVKELTLLIDKKLGGTPPIKEHCSNKVHVKPYAETSVGAKELPRELDGPLTPFKHSGASTFPDADDKPAIQADQPNNPPPQVDWKVSQLCDMLKRAFDEDQGHSVKYGGEFESSSKAAIEWLKWLVVRGYIPAAVKVSDLEETLKQLKDRDILISVFGHYNAGKSTLLNALMSDCLLPVGERAQTSLRLKIKHSNEPQMCPQLVETNTKGGKGYLAINPTEGSDEILKTLRDIDHEAQAREEPDSEEESDDSETHPINAHAAQPFGSEVTSELVIRANVPAISDVPPSWNVHLVDNPGSGAAHQGVDALVSTALKTSSAYVFTVAYDQIQAKETQEYFKHMLERDIDVFQNNRLVIAVTKFDQRGEIQEAAKPREELRTSVKKWLETHKVKINQSKMKISVASERIVPVSGKWASIARQLKQHKENGDLKRHATRCFWDCYRGPCGQGQMVPNTTTEELVETLEEESGIKELEEQIGNMAKCCATIWVRTISTSCSGYLSAALLVLKRRITQLEKSIEEQSNWCEEVRKNQKALVRVEKEIDESLKAGSSKEHSEIDRCYNDDKQELIQNVKEYVDRLKQKCTEVTAKKFEEEFKKFLITTTTEINRCRGRHFPQTFDHLLTLATTIGERSTRLSSAADKYCGLENKENGRGSRGKKMPDEAIVDDPPNLQKLKHEVSSLLPPTKRWDTFKELFTGSKLRGEDLQKPFEGLKHALEKECEAHYEKIRSDVVSYIFNQGYCDDLVDRLDTFEERYRGPINEKDNQVVRVSETIQKLKKGRGIMLQWCVHLETLKEHIAQKANQHAKQLEHDMGAQFSSHESSDEEKSIQKEMIIPREDTEERKPLRTLAVIRRSIKHHKDTVEYSDMVNKAQKPGVRKYPTLPRMDIPKVAHTEQAKLVRQRAKETFQASKRAPKVGGEDDLHVDVKKDFMSTCEAAAGQLKVFSKDYPTLLNAVTTSFIDKWKQVEKTKIRIGVFGRQKSGKSTLLNAMLRDMFLPVERCPRSVEISIQHKKDAHQGPCYRATQLQDGGENATCELKGCPVLTIEETHCNKKVCRGATAISQYLQYIADKEPHELDHELPVYDIEASMSILTYVEPWKVCLVKHAGFTEPDEKPEKMRLENAVKAAEALVYTLPYPQLMDASNTKLLKEIIRQDESVFREKRAVVVLTHFEKWYSTPTDDKKSIEEIKEDICREIEGATHVKVDVECIVPVSGKWALIARQLRYCSGQDDLKEKAQSYLRIYIIANHGNVEEVGQLQPVEIASKLLAASGITALEKRIITPMSTTCSNHSITRLSGDFSRFISVAIDSLEGTSSAIEEFAIQVIDQVATLCKAYAEKKLEVDRAPPPTESQVFVKLLALTDPEGEQAILDGGMLKCQNMLNQFQEEYIQQHGKQGPVQLEDILQLLPKLSEVLQNAVTRETFMYMREEALSCLMELEKVYQSMTETAKALKSNEATNITARSKATAEMVDQVYMGAMTDLLKYEITDSELKARYMTPVLAERRELADSHVEQSCQQLKEIVRDIFQYHIKVVRQNIAKRLYEHYCKVAQRKFHHFKEEFGDLVESKQKELEQKLREKEEWQKERNKIERWQKRLFYLKQYLKEKAEECEKQLAESRQKPYPED